MQIVFGYAGLLCLNMALYKALAAQRLELFVPLALIVGVMSLLLLKIQFSTVRPALTVRLLEFSSLLLLNAGLYAGNYWYAWGPGFSISIFLIVQLIYLVIWLRYYQQRKEAQI